MTINPDDMSQEQWRELLVPDDDVMARVGGFVLDEVKLNLPGLLDIYNKAVAEAKLFGLLVGMAETIVQKFHLRDDPDALEAFKTDIADEAQVVKLEHEVIRKLGPVDILINNAGINIRKLCVEYTLAEWNSVLTTNLTSAFLMCRSFVPHMKGRGYGRIVNITSIMAHISLPQRTAYSASKAGLLGFTTCPKL